MQLIHDLWRRGHVTPIYSYRDNKFQTSSRTVLFLVNFSYLSAIANTEFVIIFSFYYFLALVGILIVPGYMASFR